MRVDKPMLSADGTECCGNAAWRRHVCPFHEGWIEGQEALEDRLAAAETVCREVTASAASGWGVNANNRNGIGIKQALANWRATL